MSVWFKEKEWWEKWWEKLLKEGAPEKGEKEPKDVKEKDGTKEVFKEGYGKEGSKDTDKRESKDGETSASVHPLVDLHQRVAALEAAVGIGAPFIAQDERPAVGEAALNQPLYKDER